MKIKTLKDIWQFTGNNGIFTVIKTLFPSAPFTSDEATSADYDYFLTYSGNKIIMEDFFNRFGEPLTSTDINTICTLLYNRFSRKWSKLYNTLTFEYNPIENYDMTESHIGHDSKTHTPTEYKTTVTETPTGWSDIQIQTPTQWKETVKGEENDNQSTASTSVYGFDSTDPVPASTATTTGKNKTEREQTGTFTTTTTKTGTMKTETEESGSFEDRTDYGSGLTRHGNIGVTTSQQMIQSERDLWLWDFFRTVYTDIDTMLVLQIYA